MRGVEFEAGGKRWVLRYDVNALVRLEHKTGRSVSEMSATLAGDAMRMGDVRAMFCAGLPADTTDTAAGDLMSEIGIPRAASLIGQAFAMAFPAAEVEGASGNGEAAETG